ncbi:MAG TPA: RICIN domain-containing protein [Kofleriaceae bacterium]|nr:RICIN domain-containing protein [Kofleriaceae bacterium]
MIAACGGAGGNPGGGGDDDDDMDAMLVDGSTPDAMRPLSTPVMPLGGDDGFYPRAIALGDGTIIAAVVAPQPSGRLGGTIRESIDGGQTFEVVGRVDGQFSIGGLCCATLYELPAPLGALPAGTLLWSASVGGDNPNAPMSIPVYASTDRGRNWSFLSNVVIASKPRSQGGLWEPEFAQLADGSLICHYSDETDSAHSQKLVARRTTDGVTWSASRDIVSLAPFAARPGMAVVRKSPAGPYVMTFEICGTDGCATHLRMSADGWNWGNANDVGLRPETLDGKHFRHAPTLAFSPTPGANGRFYLIGQMLYDRNGVVTGGNGAVILANTEGGYGRWYEVPAPVPVTNAYDNFCPNYSSAILPVDGGLAVLEIASKYDGNRCRPYFARGPLRGTGDATGLADGASYRMTALVSGFCVDVINGLTTAGANIRQWDCNGANAQRFRIAMQPDGTAQLVNVGSGMCATAVGNPNDPGANVEQQPCTGASRWKLANVGMGYYVAAHAGTGSCLDVAGGSGTMGANIQQWTCNDLSPQIWRFDP